MSLLHALYHASRFAVCPTKRASLNFTPSLAPTWTGNLIMPRKPSKLSRRGDRRLAEADNVKPQDTLTRLPLELVHTVCSSLDILALSNLRRTCRTAKSMIDGYPPYHWLAAHHPWVIRAMIKARATHPTCAKAYSVLRSEACSLCGEQIKPDVSTPSAEPTENVLLHVGFFYLPTADAICRICSANVTEEDRAFTPWSEPHPRKHLSQLRKEHRNRGEDIASLDWERTRLLPCVLGLPKMPHPADSGRRARRKARQDPGWLRPKLYDSHAVGEMFGDKLGKMQGSWRIACRSFKCRDGDFERMEEKERDRVVLPLVSEEGSEALFVYHEVFYDEAPKGVQSQYEIRPRISESWGRDSMEEYDEDEENWEYGHYWEDYGHWEPDIDPVWMGLEVWDDGGNEEFW
ncbi:hypothetical protein QBC34DRAFT_391786 [Podospora aff. communis PSN243]|uniref:F-box domain-containing protein n=1 Tax=Podospora aff. communis PSN243 TaxID=3040156 RepID=A0AAV9H5N5_9PEZI|nr:hypothetical protein QBC34DRAFT_391786 [Podospora aff. communis PSN243]